MLLKRIHAPSLQEAINKVEKECGKDALVVKTMHTSRGITIVAGQQTKALSHAKRTRQSTSKSSHRWTRGFADLAAAATQQGVTATVLEAIENALIGTGVHLDRPGDPAIPGISSRILKSLIKTEDLNLLEHRVLAFAGPTGVGKTTTLAKIAAQAVKERGESVSIITTDTYRIAAVEQLRAFADMLSTPFEVAFTPLDLRRALHRHSQADRIFIDTTGHGPFDRDAITNLRGTLHGSDPSVVLCLAASTRHRDGLAILEGYSPVNPVSAIITKWDETEAPGEILSLLVEQGIAVSQITTGQRVPEDILPANPGALASSMFSLS